MRKSFQAAVTGAGFRGRAHIEALRRLGNLEVAAVCGATEAEAWTLADVFGIERASSSYSDILRDPADSSAVFTDRSEIRTKRPEYPQFIDGVRQMRILEAEVSSNAGHGWVEVK